MREQTIPDRGISINEAIGLLDLEDEINLEDIIQEQTTSAKQSMLEGGIINDFNHSISFVIPLTTYIPLPEPYHASMVGYVPNSNPIVMSSVSVVSIVSKLINLSFGEKSIPVRISILVASVPLKEHVGVLENPTKLHDAYLDALQAGNDVISSYKITPNRHNHFLQALTELNTPGICFAAIYDVLNRQIIQKGDTLVHGHMLSEIYESRTLKESELANFIKIHTSMSVGESIPLWLTKQINDAIDARCMGHHTEAVILADHYAELVIRFLILGALKAGGASDDTIRQQAKDRSNVVGHIENLASILELSNSDFKNRVRFANWQQNCRKLRNDLSHVVKIITIDANQSFRAVDSTTTMVKNICELVNKKYPGAFNDTQWLMSASWLTESIKAQNRKKKDRYEKK